MKFIALFIYTLTIALTSDISKADPPEKGTKACRKKPRVVGKSLSTCKKSSEKLNRYFEACSENPRAYFSKDVSSAITKCYSRIMIIALDKRLKRLKKNNPFQFKQEMKLQAIFNKKLNAYCIKRDTSATGEAYYSCVEHLIRYRAIQAQLIAQHKLEIGAKKAKSKHIKILQSFASGLCAMPVQVWQDKKAPKDCINKVLGELDTYTFSPIEEK